MFGAWVSDVESVIPALSGIRRKLNCGQLKASQIARAEIIPIHRIGSRTYAYPSDIDRLPALFADPQVQARYFAASYERARRARRAESAAAERASLTRAARQGKDASQ